MEICRALATKPAYLLLDEVMAGLNPTEVHEIIELLRKLNERGVGLVIIEHIMSAIMSISKRIVVMQDGGLLAQGCPEEIASNPAVIEAYLGKAKKYA
jgi:ABC-type branched-subunit amino acid transport system ATPase component